MEWILLNKRPRLLYSFALRWVAFTITTDGILLFFSRIGLGFRIWAYMGFLSSLLLLSSYYFNFCSAFVHSEVVLEQSIGKAWRCLSVLAEYEFQHGCFDVLHWLLVVRSGLQHSSLHMLLLH